MFSTSMMASSTTSPNAMTSPARTIVSISASAVSHEHRGGDQREGNRDER